MNQWRLIPLLETDGVLQMAIDRWLLHQCAGQGHPPTLRFYTWSPAAISLGRFQKHCPKHWEKLSWQGQPIDLVRRPTGGRAVLHVNDLTYSIVLPHQSGHRRQTYEYICGFLIQGWRSLGINLEYGTAGRGYIGQANCFESATAADLITESGAKLIGSAQAWQGNTVLQHGSLQLQPEPNLWEIVFDRELHTPTLTFPRTQVMEHLVQAAAEYFEIELNITTLTESEWSEIRALQEPSPV